MPIRPSKQLLELNSHATEVYHAALAGSPGEEYLAGRGLLGGAERFKLGYVAEPVHGHEERFTGCISIPYLTRAGTVSMKFRRLDDGKPKYDQMQGNPQHLYNVTAILEAVSLVLITEGELDAVAATMAGFPACGIAGANAWKPRWARVFDGIETVLIVTDNDVKEDGKNPGQELARRLRTDIPDSISVSPPPGHDVCSMIAAYGEQALASLVEVR